jgi:hypothetical protein
MYSDSRLDEELLRIEEGADEPFEGLEDTSHDEEMPASQEGSSGSGAVSHPPVEGPEISPFDKNPSFKSAKKRVDSSKEDESALSGPLSSPENEEAILGAIVFDGSAIIRVADSLTPDDFSRTKHKIIFKSMLAIFERDEPIDAPTLAEQFKKDGIFDDIGGFEEIVRLSQCVVTAANIESYAKIVKSKSTMRHLLSATNAITTKIR